MKVFVTGSTGLLGNNLVRLLVQQGHKVKALVRSPQKATKTFENLRVTLVQGDMLDIDAFANELKGCDALFHCAGYFREYYQPGDHWQMLESINIKGSVRLLEIAEQQSVGKVIYVSSSGVIGKNKQGQLSDETTPANGISYSNLYFKSKVFAETAVDEFIQHHTLPVVLILPGWMFGPGDFAPTDSGRLVLDFIQKKLPVNLPGGSAIVDVRDVAQAMINAVEKGKSGERYLVAGNNLSMKSLAKTLSQVTGIPAPKFSIPYKVLMFLAFLSESYGRLTGQPILLSRSGIKVIHANIGISSEKAIQELGATFRPIAETLHDEVEWFQGLESRAKAYF
jgi:dihydroflavonol-4-reductase